MSKLLLCESASYASEGKCVISVEWGNCRAWRESAVPPKHKECPKNSKPEGVFQRCCKSPFAGDACAACIQKAFFIWKRKQNAFISSVNSVLPSICCRLLLALLLSTHGEENWLNWTVHKSDRFLLGFIVKYQIINDRAKTWDTLFCFVLIKCKQNPRLVSWRAGWYY